MFPVASVRVPRPGEVPPGLAHARAYLPDETDKERRKRLSEEKRRDAAYAKMHKEGEKRRKERDKEEERRRSKETADAERRRKERDKEEEKRRKEQERRRSKETADAERRRKEEEKEEEKRRKAEDKDAERRRKEEEKRRKEAEKEEEKRHKEDEKRNKADERALYDTIQQRLKEERALTRRFAHELATVACGLDAADGWSAERIARLPMGTLADIAKHGTRAQAAEALAAFEAQVRRLRAWTYADGEVARQGTRGFNALATRVLHAAGVDGARACGVVLADGTRAPMLHQAAARALFHPLTPIKRALAIHPTGTGKSFVMINVLDNYFHDARDKIVLVPSYVVQLQIVQDLITLLPTASPLKAWYRAWKADFAAQADAPEARRAVVAALDRVEAGAPGQGDTDALWHVVAALAFQTMLSRHAAAAPPRAAQEDEDADEEEHETGDSEDKVRPPEMYVDRRRSDALKRMRAGLERHPWELGSRVVFLTYQDHKLGTYRFHDAFRREGDTRAPRVSYDDRVVLVDEMHNLFDERNPNLNAVQRRKLFGDREHRERALARLANATEDADKRRHEEAVLIYAGLSKVLQRSKRCVLVGLTATPIVDGRDGARAATKVLEWVRGARAATKDSGGASDGSDAEEGAHDASFEGYVSMFGVRPRELFAAADETSFPTLLQVRVDLPAEALAADEESVPTYGLGRLEKLAEKYDVARSADDWYERHNKNPYGVVPKARVEYVERSKAWTPDAPRLMETTEPMPEWSADGLKPYARSQPRVGQSAWVHRASAQAGTAWRESMQPCWIAGRVEFKESHPVRSDDGTANRLGRRGTVAVDAANLKARVVPPDAVVERAGATTDTLKVKWRDNKGKAHNETLRAFDAKLFGNTKIVPLDAAIEGEDGDAETTDVPVGDAECFTVADVAYLNLPTTRATRDTKHIDYKPEYVYYEKEQKDVVYARRLARYKQEEGSHWMNVFYGGRQTRAAQGSAATAAHAVGGLRDPGELTGFAIDMARTIVKDAFARPGEKCLWLLHEAHGLALVRKWMETDEARALCDTTRVAVFGAFRAEDRVKVQKRVKGFLDGVYNAADNLHGERCHLFIGGAGDLGVGVTFTEVRHIYLDLTASHFNVVQQMGRGERLCKHARLADAAARTLAFHLPVPVLTSGWAGGTRAASASDVAVTVEQDDYVAHLKAGTRRAKLTAALHVPVHAFDTLVDLQRSRVQFLSGMQTFDAVAVDRAFYRAKAGWIAPRVALADEPYDKGKVAAFVRDCVRRDTAAFADEGREALARASRENARKNAAVLARDPAAQKTRASAAEDAYRAEVARLSESAQRKEQRASAVAEKEKAKAEKEKAKAEKEKAKAEKEKAKAEKAKAKAVAEEAERRKNADASACTAYDVSPTGLLVRRDKTKVTDQAAARALVRAGAEQGDPHCQVLEYVLQMIHGA